MDIKDIQPKTGNIDVIGNIVEKSEPREFEKFGKQGRVCNAKIQDDLGDSCSLTLWNEQVDQVNVGDRVQITNGYANEWRDELQLSTGKFGKLEVVGSADPNAPAPAPEAQDQTPSEPSAPTPSDNPTTDNVEEESISIDEESI